MKYCFNIENSQKPSDRSQYFDAFCGREQSNKTYRCLFVNVHPGFSLTETFFFQFEEMLHRFCSELKLASSIVNIYALKKLIFISDAENEHFAFILSEN
jgi:hypothetical protein